MLPTPYVPVGDSATSCDVMTVNYDDRLLSSRRKLFICTSSSQLQAHVSIPLRFSCHSTYIHYTPSLCCCRQAARHCIPLYSPVTASRYMHHTRSLLPLTGGSAGGGAGYFLMAGKFNSAAQVIRDLPEDQKRQLVDRVRHLVSRLDAQDAVTAVTMLALGGGLTDLRSAIISQAVHYLTNELAMEVSGGAGRDGVAAW